METLNPAEKANQLVDQMMSPVDQWHKYPMCRDTALQCSIITVKHLINETGRKYWYDVKHELENF